MLEKIRSVSKEIEDIKKNQRIISGLKYIIIEIKNSMNELKGEKVRDVDQ